MNKTERPRHAGAPQSAMAARREELIKLREGGHTSAEIGRRFGITRERVRQIVSPKPKSSEPARKESDPRSKLMLTAGETAILLGLHINTVRRWAAQGRLKFYRVTPRGDRRFRREDIDAFLAERSRDAANGAD